MLKVVESSLRFCCLGELISFPEKPIEGESLFAKLAYEATERR
jgi:hypothetical protein